MSTWLNCKTRFVDMQGRMIEGSTALLHPVPDRSASSRRGPGSRAGRARWSWRSGSVGGRRRRRTAGSVRCGCSSRSSRRRGRCGRGGVGEGGSGWREGGDECRIAKISAASQERINNCNEAQVPSYKEVRHHQLGSPGLISHYSICIRLLDGINNACFHRLRLIWHRHSTIASFSRLAGGPTK